MTGGKNKILSCLKRFSREDLEELPYWSSLVSLLSYLSECLKGKSITLELLLVAALSCYPVSSGRVWWYPPMDSAMPLLGHTLLWGREELWLSLVAGSSWTSGTQYFSHMFLLKGTSLLFSWDQDSSYWASTWFHCSMNTSLHPAYNLVQDYLLSPNSHT